jgi:type II secretory pathway pseudopilin PulG
MSKFRTITILFFSLFIVMPLSLYFIHKNKAQTRNQLIQNVISDINQYKLQHGSYPSDITTASTKDANGLYYYYDSISNSFSLNYTKGFMNCNTVSYDSKTKNWTTKFNY